MEPSRDQCRKIQESICAMLRKRTRGASICPSEVARELFAATEWREQMQTVREVAQEMAREGKLEIAQKGNAVDPDKIRGPIRLRFPPTST